MGTSPQSTPKNRCYFTGYVKTSLQKLFKDENSLSKTSYGITLFVESQGTEQPIQLRFQDPILKNALNYIKPSAILSVKAEFVASEFVFDVVFFKVIGFKVGYYNNENKPKIMVDK